MATRRQALRAAAQQQLRLHYEPAQHLFTQWSRVLFAHLLQQDAMHQFDLEVALNEPLVM